MAAVFIPAPILMLVLVLSLGRLEQRVLNPDSSRRRKRARGMQSTIQASADEAA